MAKLILRVPGDAETEISLDDKDSVTIGRSPECDLPITDGQASRRHASVAKADGGGYEVADLGSTNGTLLNDVQVKKRLLNHGDVIRIGATEIAYDDPDAAPAAGGESGVCTLVYAKGPRKGQKIDLSAQRTTLGRKDSNTVVLQDTVASSYHCEVVRDLNGYTLRDLGSTNGTLVNNEMVTETQLVHGARIRIGNTRFVFQDPAMSEIDLELAGVDDDEAEWGMMRDLDLASVRKRNPATLVYGVLFLGMCGALWWLTTNPPSTGRRASPDGPDGNRILPYGFPRASSALYREEFTARRQRFRVSGKVSGSGRLGLVFRGGELEQWVLAPPGSSQELEASAPPWANRAQVGVRVPPGETARIDDVALVPQGPARVERLEHGNFWISTVDGRQLELSYAGAPTLARGLPFAEDAAGSRVDAGGLSVEVAAEDDSHVDVTIRGADAARLGVEFTEVGDFLTQGGWRAFTPGREPEFHPAFPREGTLRIDGVRKLLVGDRGRAFSCAPVDGSLVTVATVDEDGNRWAVIGPVADGAFSFRIKTNLRGESVAAEAAVTKALQLHANDRWGEFLDAAQGALAEFPFMSLSSKTRLVERMSAVTAERTRLQREARRAIEGYDEFKDMESLDRVREVLEALAGRHQVKSAEGPVGEVYAELATTEAKRRNEARKTQHTKKAEAYIALGELAMLEEEPYSAAVYFSYIVDELPAAEQAADARERLAAIEEAHPEIKRVFGKVKGR